MAAVSAGACMPSRAVARSHPSSSAAGLSARPRPLRQLARRGDRALSGRCRAVEEPEQRVQTEVEAAGKSEASETLGEVLRKRRSQTGKSGVRSASVDIEEEMGVAPDDFVLDRINPYMIGRKSRAAFDTAWNKLASLGSFSANSMDFYDGADAVEAPQAAYTTVMVVGATGRVGRVVVRKLLLRGYTVKVFTRNPDAQLPTSVEVIQGDVGDYPSVKASLKGVDKVIYCASARSSITADLARVESTGVSNFVKALQDQYNVRAISGGKSKSSRAKVTVAQFKNPEHCEAWSLEHIGSGGGGSVKGVLDRGQDYAKVTPTEDKNLRFTGAVYSRSGYAEIGADISGAPIAQTDGLLLRLLGDGNAYTVILTTESGSMYSARFNTKKSYNTIRLPFNSFRPLDFNDPAIEPTNITHMSLRFEPKRGGGGGSGFAIDLDYIKGIPSGEESDFMLISRASGREGKNAEEAAQLSKIIEFKRKGETALRNSGLGYTIIRSAELIEEPGGYRALVFDQGSRIQNSISCADVADVCVKALHESTARNKTFDVCHEYTSEDGQYELIAHLPDKSSNYLNSALRDLQSMT